MSGETKNEKTVLIAEASKTLSKMIASVFESRGYSVKIAADGLTALLDAIEIEPDLVAADGGLPRIDGLSLCAILKEGFDKKRMPIIVFSTEDPVIDFWSDASAADKIVSIADGNLDALASAADEIVFGSYLNAEIFFDGEQDVQKTETKLDAPKKALLWSVRAMDRSGFYSNMMKKIFDLFRYVGSPDVLAANIFKSLYDFCRFDAAIMILNDSPAKVYSAGFENCVNGEEERLWKICGEEFKRRNEAGKILNYEKRSVSDVVSEPKRELRFASYMQFVINAGEDFIGVIHVAACGKKAFSYKIASSAGFFASKIGWLIQESLVRERIVVSENRLRSTFSKFVPEEIIDEMLASQNEVGANVSEKRKVAILMCDIRNFTSISEINQPEEVVCFLNDYFTRMVDIVKKHGGTVDKFIGDAIMVLFGAPISYVDNARRAVQAALEMYSRLGDVGRGRLKFPQGTRLDVGIGIHYGEVIVGNIGSSDKTNYTVIGDAVNLSSRLEGLTKIYGAKIVVSQAISDEIGEGINVYELDSVMVKGKKQSVNIFRVCEKPLPIEFAANYGKGLALYRSGAWTLAEAYFTKAAQIIPNDKAVSLMLDRCREFNLNPPIDWNGAIALNSKG